MKLSISNIAWSNEYDEEMYTYLNKNGIEALEIAPTRIIEKNPYEYLNDAEVFAKTIYDKFSLVISSMQSIWYGRNENIFNEEDAKKLSEYTKQAIDFAEKINCKNLVFGCPKNRNNFENADEEKVISFFRTIGEYAKEKNIVIAIEPNPKIYGTNFINYTCQAFEFVKKINCDGIKVNLDFGTIIENNENINEIEGNIQLINHIHISEPNLGIIQKRESHKEFAKILKYNKYNKYISIEMKNFNDINCVKKTIQYVKDIFNI